MGENQVVNRLTMVEYSNYDLFSQKKKGINKGSKS